MKGCICYFKKWQIHPFMSKAYEMVLLVHVPLDMKGCSCHFTKWQIHPFKSNGTNTCLKVKVLKQWWQHKQEHIDISMMSLIPLRWWYPRGLYPFMFFYGRGNAFTPMMWKIIRDLDQVALILGQQRIAWFVLSRAHHVVVTWCLCRCVVVAVLSSRSRSRCCRRGVVVAVMTACCRRGLLTPVSVLQADWLPSVSYMSTRSQPSWRGGPHGSHSCEAPEGLIHLPWCDIDEGYDSSSANTIR